MKEWNEKLKQQLIKDVINKQQNAIIPSTASKLDSFKKMVKKFKDAGYTIRLMIVYSSFELICQQGVDRGQKSG